MGMRDDKFPEDTAEVSMSPLIDCVFLLLIFFLVSTIMKKPNSDIDVNLPEAESAVEILPASEQIVIGIDADSQLYINGVASTRSRLHVVLREQFIGNPEMRIRLDSDAQAPVHKVIEVLDLCQFNNLKNVWIRTYDKNYNRAR